MNPWAKYEDRHHDEDDRAPVDAGRRHYCRRTNKFRCNPVNTSPDDEQATWDGMANNYGLGRQSQLPSQNFYKNLR